MSDAVVDTDIASTQRAPACKHTGGLRLLSSGRELVPALGLAWANCINTRLFLSRTEVTIASSSCQTDGPQSATTSTVSLPLRYMQVVFSPCLPQETCLYLVTQSGLQGIDKASAGFAQRQGLDSRQADTKQHALAWQQPVEQRPMSDREANCQAERSEAYHNMQPAIAADTSLCPSNRTLAHNSSAHLASQRACTLATGIFAPG